MKYFNNILETIGNTPLIKLNKITKSLNSDVFVKVESFNPGNSVKDRMAVKMIEDAEKEGKINSGGTIVEGTSGNTGMGLALAAIVKGYKLICVSNDKQSKEKFDVLRAMGAKVIVCPTNVEASDPRSYYSVSKRISEETENSWYVNQYDNPSNTIAHYLSRWRQFAPFGLPFGQPYPSHIRTLAACREQTGDKADTRSDTQCGGGLCAHKVFGCLLRFQCLVTAGVRQILRSGFRLVGSFGAFGFGQIGHRACQRRDVVFQNGQLDRDIIDRQVACVGYVLGHGGLHYSCVHQPNAPCRYKFLKGVACVPQDR